MCRPRHERSSAPSGGPPETYCLACRIHIHLLHQLEVDNQSTVGQGGTRHIVATTSNRHFQIVRASKTQRGDAVLEDLAISTDSRTLTLVHLGRLNLADAEREGIWHVDGPPALVRGMAT